MKKQRNQIIILFMIVILGFVYSYVQYLFIPQWYTLEEKSAQLAAHKEKLVKLEAAYQDFSALKTLSGELKSQVSVLQNKIPQKVDKPDMMLTIYNLAKKNEVAPQSLNYESIQDMGGYLTMGMNFSCVGSIENIYKLLQQLLKENPYIFVLDSIKFSQAEGITSAQMRLVAYIYK